MSAGEGAPPPLSTDEAGAGEEVRRALAAAKLDLPSQDHVERLLASFPFPPPGGGGPADGGAAPAGGAALGAAASKGATAKVAALLGALALASGGTYLALRAPPQPPADLGPATTSAAELASAEPAAASPSTSALAHTASSASPVACASATATPAAPRTSGPPLGSAAASASAPPRSELELLKEAHQSRAQNPSRALELVNEHAAAYPKSALGQEREMIRIEALLNSGKRAEAKALADAFRARNPTSAYARRLDALFPPTGG